MNIQPVKTDAVQVPSKARPKSARDAAEPSGAPASETTSRKERLTESLANEPDVRPEMLERADLTRQISGGEGLAKGRRAMGDHWAVEEIR